MLDRFLRRRQSLDCQRIVFIASCMLITPKRAFDKESAIVTSSEIPNGLNLLKLASRVGV